VASNALEIIGPVRRGAPVYEFSETQAAEICDRLIEGESLTSICSDPDMPSRVTVYKWIREYPDFANDYARARVLQADTFADEVQEVAKNLAILPEHKRVMIDAMKWRAARQNWRAWGDKVSHEHEIQLRPAAGEEQLPEGIGFLRGFLHGGDASPGPGPDTGGVGEE
jgi:hypothetical protein